MKNNWKKILNELSYRVSSGIPDLTNEQHLMKLWDILKEHKWPVDARVELLKNLNEAIGKVYTKKGKQPKGAKLMTGPRGGLYYYGDKETGRPAKPEEIPDEEDSPEDKSGKTTKQEIDKALASDSTNPERRITNEKVRQEFLDDEEKSDKEKKEIKEALDALDELPELTKENVLLLTARAHLYGKRDNAGFMKNSLGIADRDQLLTNKKPLLDLYDEEKPEVIEKEVRKIRKNKVSEKVASETFDTLPEGLKRYLMSGGKAGSNLDDGTNIEDKHFIGYRKTDGTITSDVNDPDIEVDENGEKVAARGKLPSKERGLLLWRIYLEQGGTCAYTGLPLDLESMDLEHIVGIKNSDKGDVTEQDFLNREHERQQVLTHSRVNQIKSDLSMKDFIEKQVEPLSEKSKEDFEAIEKAKKESSVIKTTSAQTAMRQLDEVTYSKKGGGSIAQSEIDELPEDERPELTMTDDGVPKVREANLGPNVTPDTLQSEFDMEDKRFSEIRNTLLNEVDNKKDKDKVKKLKSKLGKRIIQGLGLPGNLPGDRRTNKITDNDNFYRGFVSTMASLPNEKRGETKQAWKDAVKHCSQKNEDGSFKFKGAEQRNEFRKMVRSKLDIDIEKYPEWEYKDENGNLV